MEEKTLPKLLVNREEAKKRIEEQIEKGKRLCEQKINSEKELEQAIKDCQKWSKSNEDILLKLFGPSPIEKKYKAFSYYTTINLDTSKPSRTKEAMNQFLMNVDSYGVWIGSYIDHLMVIQNQLEIHNEPSNALPRTFGNKVFIVHGHDEAAKHKIARFVEGLGLTVTVLDEQASRGQTIIDKFKEHADEAGFAVVLLTADDVGAPRDTTDELKPRARQNVIMELGYFLCRLGRERVCILYETDVELPSDIRGLLYIIMDNAGGWKLKVGKEMKIAGLPINPENLL